MFQIGDKLMVVEKYTVSILKTEYLAKSTLNELPLVPQGWEFHEITYIDCTPQQTLMLDCVINLRTSEYELRSWLANWELVRTQTWSGVLETLEDTPRMIIRGGDKIELNDKNRVCSMPNFIFYWKYDPVATGPCDIKVISKSQLNKSHTEQLEFCGFRECIRLDLNKSMQFTQFNTGFRTKKINTELDGSGTITTKIFIFNIQEPLITITAGQVQLEDHCGNRVFGCHRFILRLEDHCDSCPSPRRTYVINGFLLAEEFNSILPVRNEMDPKFGNKGDTLKVRLSDYYCGPIKLGAISPLEDYTGQRKINGNPFGPKENPRDSTQSLYISRDQINSEGKFDQ